MANANVPTAAVVRVVAGEHVQQRVDRNVQDVSLLEDKACPGAGAFGGQFTANTMAIVCETLGIAALGSGSVPATDARKAQVAREIGALVVKLIVQLVTDIARLLVDTLVPR